MATDTNPIRSIQSPVPSNKTSSSDGLASPSTPQILRRQSSTKNQKKTFKQKFCIFMGVGGLEPRPLDFMSEAAEHLPGHKWQELSTNDQAEIIRRALAPRELMLDPGSHYLKYWDMIILSALVFTATVTPYEVGFLETQLDGLFGLNCFVDLIFLKDMVLQFFLKVPVTSIKAGTSWIRDRKTISRRYLKSWFSIDLISILPFNIVGLAIDDPAVQKFKVVRVIRLLKLLKLVRVVRASRIMKRWQNRTSMSFSAQGLCRFTILLTIIAHWMACIWGMFGLLFASALKCDGPNAEIDDDIHGQSWVTGHSWGPNSPCNHVDVYLASLHFSVMTITSIGYGDITPSRNEEFALCILCQLGGGLTWAYIIGSICGIIANANPTRVEFEQSMDALNRMLKEQEVPFELSCKLREYVREQQYHHFLLRARRTSDNFSPELQGRLTLETAIGRAIKNIWYFMDCETDFVVHVARSLEAAQYGPRDKVGQKGTLSIIQRGSIVRSGRILLPGNFWGEDMILASQYLADARQGMTLNFAEVFSLEKTALDQVLVYFPHMEVKIRKAAVWIAFRIAVRMVARERMTKRKGRHPGALTKCFNMASGGDETAGLLSGEAPEEIRTVFAALGSNIGSGTSSSKASHPQGALASIERGDAGGGQAVRMGGKFAQISNIQGERQFGQSRRPDAMHQGTPPVHEASPAQLDEKRPRSPSEILEAEKAFNSVLQGSSPMDVERKLSDGSVLMGGDAVNFMKSEMASLRLEMRAEIVQMSMTRQEMHREICNLREFMGSFSTYQHPEAVQDQRSFKNKVSVIHADDVARECGAGCRPGCNITGVSEMSPNLARSIEQDVQRQRGIEI